MKKEEFKSTTGKVYKEGNVYCKRCGFVYDSDRDKCPDCGCPECVPYHQTSAKIPKRVLTDDENSVN